MPGARAGGLFERTPQEIKKQRWRRHADSPELEVLLRPAGSRAGGQGARAGVRRHRRLRPSGSPGARRKRRGRASRGGGRLGPAGALLPAGDRGHGLHRSGRSRRGEPVRRLRRGRRAAAEDRLLALCPWKRLLAGHRRGAQGFGGVRQAQREARGADLLPGPQRGLHRLELRRADAPDSRVRPASRRRLSRSRPPRPRRRGLGDGAGDGPRSPLGRRGQGRHVPPRAGEEAPVEPLLRQGGGGVRRLGQMPRHPVRLRLRRAADRAYGVPLRRGDHPAGGLGRKLAAEPGGMGPGGRGVPAAALAALRPSAVGKQ